MKPRNFPARKLQRQVRAQTGDWLAKPTPSAFEAARAIRTKKPRGGQGKLA